MNRHRCLERKFADGNGSFYYLMMEIPHIRRDIFYNTAPKTGVSCDTVLSLNTVSESL